MLSRRAQPKSFSYTSDYADSDDHDDSYRPMSNPPASPKRGRKPASGSRSARDQLRKTNHSLIEKRRREKINDTMSALRDLVPVGPRAQHIDPQEPGDSATTGQKKEKDFKLEVLVRTVAYMRELLDKVKSLEEQLQSASVPCSKCHSVAPLAQHDVSPTPRKRKRDSSDSDAGTRADRNSPCILPPISSFLDFQTLHSNPHPLPSPPLTAPILPTRISDVPPILALPDPTRSTNSVPSAVDQSIPMSSTMALSSARHSRERPLHSRPPSPTSPHAPTRPSTHSSPWTPDEQNAASLLLHISTKRKPGRPDAPGPLERTTVTPGTLLGLPRMGSGVGLRGPGLIG